MASAPTAKEARIKDEATAFAKQHKKEIAKRLTDPKIYPPEEKPVSVFMAGSPGAGKTEASIALLETLEAGGANILRIDPDELRPELPGYDGSNSWLFHSAVSLLVERIHDLVLQQQQSFILDGNSSSHARNRKDEESGARTSSSNTLPPGRASTSSSDNSRKQSKRKPQTAKSTALSDFIRNASSRQKKRVYATVLKKSTEKQNELLERRSRAADSAS